MNNRSIASIPSSKYDDFLFAPIYEDADGSRRSVLSALARMEVDPWEEATKLAAMPKAIARSTLISTLELLSGRSWNLAEAEMVAARLIKLLPEGEASKAAAGEVTGVAAQRTNYWLVWLALAMAISFLSSSRHQATGGADQSKSLSSTTSPAQDVSAKSKLPAANVRSR